ncbi:MAG: tetratricopeptide repeat protein, partial [Planctomycetaceae bacterium]|nr:tetratricopeptide repeat protein [Planctomycetaceae bacterium]
EKLHRPWEAVRCLEQGGLFDEAVKLYEELEAYEKIGDLYVRLEQPDEAEQAYQRAVDQFVKKDDYLAAAKLQEQKLHDVDAALTTLDAGWPRSGQARACLDESFRMLGRLGRHEAARQRVSVLGRQTLRDDRMPLLVDGLVEAAVGYPDDEVQRLAADVARVSTSRVLKRRRVNSKPLLDALRRLAPQDRLLDRDCHRFARTSKPKPVAKPTTSKQNSGGVLSFIPEQIREYQFNRDVDWSKCQLTSRGFYVSGFRKKEIVLTRGGWNTDEDELASCVWSPKCNSDRPILMAVNNLGDVYLDFGFPDFGDISGLERAEITPDDDFRNRSVAGTPGWLPFNKAGFALTPAGHLWCIESDFKTLKVIDGSGTPLSIRELPRLEGSYDLSEWPPPEIPIYARDDGGLIGVGPHLLAVTKKDVSLVGDSHTPIRSIVGAIPFSSRQVVVLSEQRGLMIWRIFENDVYEAFYHPHESPTGTFMRDGRLVVVGDAGMSIYSTENEELKLLAESSYAIPDALGACQLPGTAHLAVCRKSGVIDVLSLPDCRRD